MVHKMNCQCFLLLLFFLFGNNVKVALSNSDGETSGLVTQTVYGFLDFTTQIGNTVMIFVPQSAPPLEITALPAKPVDIIKTKPITEQKQSTEIVPTKLATSEKQTKESTIKTINTEIAQKDYSNQPEFDLLSRQPEAFAEESYHVVDLPRKKPGSRKSTGGKNSHPVGLVTTLSGKVAMDGTTTIHETSVIGTYISGKYAQVLQSSFHVLNNNVSPSSTVRILRTEAPNIQGSRHFNSQSGRFKNRTPEEPKTTTESNANNSFRKHGSGGKHKAKGHQKNKSNKSPRSSYRESTKSSTSYESRRTPFRQRIQQPSTTSTIVTSSATVKIRPAGRWQYKATAKPKVYIRKATDLSLSPSQTITTENEAINTFSSSFTDVTAQPSNNVKIEKQINNNLSEEETPPTILYPVETLNIDIVTPSDFENKYFEIATIKTPYTFQIGGVKKTRYITVTSTTEKSLETEYEDKLTEKEPLIENILATTTPISQLLQANSITTFPACTLSDATETPSLESYIETFTQTQLKLKTQVFPIVGVDKSTNLLTLLQTYGITTLITATKTTPACAGNNFNEFNTKLDESGSEIHLDLEFGDLANAEPDDVNTTAVVDASSVNPISKEESSKKQDDPITNFYPTFSPDQLQQLAYLKLLQQNGQVPQQFASPSPSPEILPVETLYESHVIPVVRGQQTSYKTLTKLISRTEPRIEIPTALPQPFPTINPFALQQPQFKVITAQTLLPTVLTQTNSRILKLTFGARTALTTIFSTNTVSTVVPTFITSTLPVSPQTAAFGGFFPPAFPPYPYIG